MEQKRTNHPPQQAPGCLLWIDEVINIVCQMGLIMMLNKFLQSTRIDFEKWILGKGYDLIALRYLQPEDKLKVEKMILRKKHKNWRDIEALDVLGTEKSIQTIVESLESIDLETKIEAAERLYQRQMFSVQQIESLLIGILWSVDYRYRLIRFEQFIVDHQSPIIYKMLVWNTVYGHQNVRFRFAALLYFLFKITESPVKDFPSNCVNFHSNDLFVRKKAFIVLCQDLKLDPKNALEGMPTTTMIAKGRKTIAYITGGFILFILIITIIVEILLSNALK
jgi:hypothetical protein